MNFIALANLLYPAINNTPDDIELLYPPRNLREGAKVTRIAPSPTGFMHLGNLFGAIADERLAHQGGGVFILRIEDTDHKREVDGGVAKILEVFSDYELSFDEGATIDGDLGNYGPYRQSKRVDLYQACAKWLVQQGRAYPCFCSEEDLARTRELQISAKENIGYYDNYAIHRNWDFDEIKNHIDNGEEFVLRFRSNGNPDHRVRFNDLIKGDIEFPQNNQDVVLLKSNGIPTYHFAHVVDDHFMRTTHVVRGEEWLATLPMHVEIFDAMHWKQPKYVHTSHLLKMEGGSKRKLSKRKDPELALDFYKEKGYSIESLHEYVMTLLNSNFEEWRIANPDAHFDKFQFSIKKMSGSGALFDMDKLDDISKNVISKLSAHEAYEKLVFWAKKFDPEFAEILALNPDYSTAVLAIGRGGKKPRKDIAFWSEAKEYMSFFYDKLFNPIYELPQNVSTEVAKDILTKYVQLYSPDDDANEWFTKIKQLTESIGFTTNMKEYKLDPQKYPGNIGDVSMVIRIALTGRPNSPDLHSVTMLLGQKKVMSRLDMAKKSL